MEMIRRKQIILKAKHYYLNRFVRTLGVRLQVIMTIYDMSEVSIDCSMASSWTLYLTIQSAPPRNLLGVSVIPLKSKALVHELKLAF